MSTQINEYIKIHDNMIGKYTRTYMVKRDIKCLKLKEGDHIAYDNITCIVKILYRKNNGGNFPKDAFECYNIPLDIKNLSFFEEYKEQKIKDGTFVLYHNNSYKKFKLYKVTKYDKTGSYKGTYTIKEVNGSDVVNNLTEANLTIPVKVYWFFNSEGSKCITYEGQNCKADEFRKMSNNYYDSKEAIDLAYAQMEGMAQK